MFFNKFLLKFAPFEQKYLDLCDKNKEGFCCKKNSATTIRASFCILHPFWLLFNQHIRRCQFVSLSLTHIPLCPFEICIHIQPLYVHLPRVQEIIYSRYSCVFANRTMERFSAILVLQIKFSVNFSRLYRVFLPWQKNRKKFSNIENVKSWKTLKSWKNWEIE